MNGHTPDILTGIGTSVFGEPCLTYQQMTVKLPALDEQASDMRRRLSEYFWHSKASDKQKHEAKERLFESLPDETKKETKREYQKLGS